MPQSTKAEIKEERDYYEARFHTSLTEIKNIKHHHASEIKKLKEDHRKAIEAYVNEMSDIQELKTDLYIERNELLDVIDDLKEKYEAVDGEQIMV